MRVPEKFAEIVKLNDEDQRTDTRLSPEARFEADVKRTGPKPLSVAIDALSDADFRDLMGWTLFGRDYSPDDGDPAEALVRFIREAVIYPRAAMGGYIEQKPIGEYLRAAVEHLERIPSDAERRAWARGKYEEEENRRCLQEHEEE
jgi:hypothetical protein